MADLQLYHHPLSTQGPTGNDNTGEEWLNGERPMHWPEEEAWSIKFSERGMRMDEKDDALGVLDDGPEPQYPDETVEGHSHDFLLQPGFAAERVESPDIFERSAETWRNTNYFQADRGASLGEESQVEEASKSGLPLTTVEQYDCGIFSRQLFPLIGQEIVLGEDQRVLPASLRQLSAEDVQDYSVEDYSIGEVGWRWTLSKKGRNGFRTYLRWMRSRRAVCKRYFPGLHNLSWYLESTNDWIRVGRTSVRGTFAITGLQLMIRDMWGPGYSQYQSQPGSWFQRAMDAGPNRILHLTLKCQHKDNSQTEGVEGSRCWCCGITARFFEMGYIETSHFFRYIEHQHLRDVFDDVYPSACSEFHEQMCQLMTHLANCDMHLPQSSMLNPAVIPLRSSLCFPQHDANVKASDVRLMARARKRLARNTDYQREQLLSEGSVLCEDYEDEPSTDLRGEGGAFHWDVNW